MELAGIERISVPKTWRIVILCDSVFSKGDGEINPIWSFLSWNPIYEHKMLQTNPRVSHKSSSSETPRFFGRYMLFPQPIPAKHAVAPLRPRLWPKHFPGDAMAIGRQIQPDRWGVAQLPCLREPFNARNEFREPVEDWLRNFERWLIFHQNRHSLDK